jgi:hypothetical protein
MHFTYEDELDHRCLHQGDVLKRTPAVENILRTVHPHYFNNPDYKYFAVLTQTCDLVRGEKRRPSRYITIAAVRPASVTLARFAESLAYNAVEQALRIADISRRDRQLRQFVGRLLNNNEDEYFFLYREPKAGLYEDHCVFLRLSIAVKSELHYENLLLAKVLQLKEAFEHKLGYILGRTYSRVGTEDWVPNHDDEGAFERRVGSYVNAVESIQWLDRDTHRAVVRKLEAMPPAEWTQENLARVLEEVIESRETRRGRLLEILQGELAKLSLNDAVIAKAKTAMANNSELRALLK